MRGSTGSGNTVRKSPWSRKYSYPDVAPAGASNSMTGNPSGTEARRSRSLKASRVPESRSTNSMVSRGNLWFTGTATSPARRMPK